METPALVARALARLEPRGFEKSCRPEAGALLHLLAALHVLAARRGISRAAEIGTAVLDDPWFDPDLPDSVRDAWLYHPLLSTIELWVTREWRALVSVRR